MTAAPDPAPRPAPAPASGDAELVARLRSGDEDAFVSLVERHQSAMLRMATVHCPRRDAAEEVVQETWLAVLEGLASFEERSSLSTWIFSILLNRAKTRGARERRSVPMTDAAPDRDGDDSDPDRFHPDGHGWAGHWAAPPRAWRDGPDRSLLAREAREAVERAVASLPPAQREVITLRDLQGLPAEDACNVLGLTETNQRVLLHRARVKVRSALEKYFDGELPG